ncbi:MAG TPA: hypothetical protein VK824_11445 [Planctomycetota bacterium]|nr:hypothetical protein [Planctomycetota bacterium]
MKKTLAASRRLDNVHLMTLAAGAFASGLLMLCGGLVAQNNDNGGILPGMSTGAAKTSQSSTDSILAVDGQMEGTVANPELGALTVSHDGYASVALATGVSPDDAEFHATGVLVAQQMPDGGLEVQGAGTLNPEIGLGLRLQAATMAAARAAVLLGDDGTHSLAELLAGKAQPFAAIALGDLPSLDLLAFHHLLQKHADLPVPIRVTVVLVSRDAAGAVHLAAVGGRTDGNLLELAFQ